METWVFGSAKARQPSATPPARSKIPGHPARMMNRSNNPHFTNIQESVRVTSPLGHKDAVLVAKGSASYALYVVAAGQKLFDHHYILVFINCGSQTPTLSWLDESRLTCQNSCEAVANHSKTVTEEIPNGTLVYTDHAI